MLDKISFVCYNKGTKKHTKEIDKKWLLRKTVLITWFVTA